MSQSVYKFLQWQPAVEQEVAIIFFNGLVVLVAKHFVYVGGEACKNKKKINYEREKSSSHALRAREKSISNYNRNNASQN